MQYNQLKTMFIDFHDSHPGYVWFVMELSMLCAAGYSLFGLVLVSTGALISGDTLRMLLGFLFAPIYALLLFITVTVVLTAILTLPYLLFLKRRTAPAAKPRKRAARKPAKTTLRSRRIATAK